MCKFLTAAALAMFPYAAMADDKCQTIDDVRDLNASSIFSEITPEQNTALVQYEMRAFGEPTPAEIETIYVTTATDDPTMMLFFGFDKAGCYRSRLVVPYDLLDLGKPA